MKKDYRVHADKIHKYTAIIEAESPETAWDYAKKCRQIYGKRFLQMT